MLQPTPEHGHTDLSDVLEWLNDDNTLRFRDGHERLPRKAYPRPDYWEIFNTPILFDPNNMEGRLEDFGRSIDAHYFKGELAEHCLFGKQYSRYTQGHLSLGSTAFVPQPNGGFKMGITIDFERHHTNRDFLETFLHEMCHAWVEIATFKNGATCCGTTMCNACIISTGATGHARDWLLLSRAVELRVEKLHGFPRCDLGRLDAAVLELTQPCYSARHREQLCEVFKAQFSEADCATIQRHLLRHIESNLAADARRLLLLF
jgi:hypothetical protein